MKFRLHETDSIRNSTPLNLSKMSKKSVTIHENFLSIAPLLCWLEPLLYTNLLVKGKIREGMALKHDLFYKVKDRNFSGLSKKNNIKTAIFFVIFCL